MLVADDDRAPEPAGAERRGFPRLSAACRIRVRPMAGVGPVGEGHEALTVNISGSGLCYRSLHALEPGTFVAVELTLPNFASPVLALARAAYCAPQGPQFDVGLEFWWVGWGDDSAQRAIGDYIKSELRIRSGEA